MSLLKEFYTLNNGVQIPKIGFGTWQIPDSIADKKVKLAIEAGYRHIDTALAYQNEAGVGKAIKDSGLKREEIFLTSKLPAQTKGYREALRAFDESLSNLGTDYLDLYLIHAPWPWEDKGGDYTQKNIDTWKAFEKLYKEKKVRAIGVSNFSPSDIEAILGQCEITPAVNQIAFYVGKTQEEYVQYCEEKGILIEAYSPLATGRALKDPGLNDIASSYGVSVAQLLIRYTLQRGVLPLPKTLSPIRMKENASLEHFTISEEDMKKLNARKTEYR